jgi:YegS/Rv2252/BmrU family lipid kinase
MSTTRPWLLIGNPAAGAGRTKRLWERFTQQVPEAVSLRIEWTRAPGHATALARSAGGQWEMLVVVGGDGTVNEVATGLIEAGARATALGILPVGTGNDAARGLGLEDIQSAWRALERGRTGTLDVIEVRCRLRGQLVTRYALVYAAAGFAATILEKTTPGIKRWAGRRGCYTIGFLRALPRWRCPEIRIECGGRIYQGRYMAATAGNAEWVGGGMMRLSPGARGADGWLNVNLIPELKGWRALRGFSRLYGGTHVSLPGVEYFDATELNVDARPATGVQVDGDVCGETPVRFRVLPALLRVRLPAAAPRSIPR